MQNQAPNRHRHRILIHSRKLGLSLSAPGHQFLHSECILTHSWPTKCKMKQFLLITAIPQPSVQSLSSVNLLFLGHGHTWHCACFDMICAEETQDKANRCWRVYGTVPNKAVTVVKRHLCVCSKLGSTSGRLLFRRPNVPHSNWVSAQRSSTIRFLNSVKGFKVSKIGRL